MEMNLSFCFSRHKGNNHHDDFPHDERIRIQPTFFDIMDKIRGLPTSFMQQSQVPVPTLRTTNNLQYRQWQRK